MDLKKLGLETLAELDGGKAVAAFNRHLHRAAQDCRDRPLDKTARKVTLTMLVTPEPEEDGSIGKVKFRLQAKGTVPEHKTKIYEANLHANGNLSFNPDSPDDADQATLFGPDADA